MSDTWGKEEVEAGNPIISLFFAPNVFFSLSPPPMSCGLAGEKVDELQRCAQGHRLRRDVQVQEAEDFVRCLLSCRDDRNTHLEK